MSRDCMAFNSLGKWETVISAMYSHLYIEIFSRENWFGEDEVIFQFDNGSFQSGLKVFFSWKVI